MAKPMKQSSNSQQIASSVSLKAMTVGFFGAYAFHEALCPGSLVFLFGYPAENLYLSASAVRSGSDHFTGGSP